MNEIDTHVSVTVMGYMAAFCVTLSLISGKILHKIKKKKKKLAKHPLPILPLLSCLHPFCLIPVRGRLL